MVGSDTAVEKYMAQCKVSLQLARGERESLKHTHKHTHIEEVNRHSLRQLLHLQPCPKVVITQLVPIHISVAFKKGCFVFVFSMSYHLSKHYYN